jgi:hypothetical protein
MLHHSESEDQQNTYMKIQLHSGKLTHFLHFNCLNNLFIIFYAAVRIGDGYINNQIAL